MSALWKDSAARIAGIWQQRWWGLWTTLAVGAIGAIVTMVLPDRFEASARVQVEPHSTLDRRLVVSRRNVERVIEMSGVGADSGESDGGDGDAAVHEALVRDLMKDVRFDAAREQNSYNIAYRASDPAIARRVVESLLKVLGETEIGNVPAGALQVVDPPRVANRPAAPSRPLLLAGVLALSLAAGAAMAMFRDASTPTFRDPRRLGEATGLPILGVINMNVDAVGQAMSRRNLRMFSTGTALYLGVFCVLIGYQAFIYSRA